MTELQSDEIDQIAEALAKAQGAMVAIPRDKEVRVKPKRENASPYTFRYATLEAIVEGVRSILSENGLAVVQRLANGDGKYRLITTLMHSSGQWLASEQPLMVPQGAGNQELGSAISYGRRYAISAMLGIVSDDDDDANSADGNTVEKSTQRAQRTQKRMDADIPKDQPPIQPQDIGPPTDENGEVLPPHMIVVPTTKDQKGEPQPDWLTWGQIWSAAIRSAETTAEVDKWLEANAAQLKNLATANARFHKRAIDLADGKKSVLLGAAA